MSCPQLQAQSSIKNSYEQKATTLLLNFYENLNNYCDLSNSLDERLQFRDDILQTYFKENTVISNDIVNNGSTIFSGQMYLDNLLSWLPSESTIFVVENVQLHEKGPNESGYFIALEYNRTIQGKLNTNVDLSNQLKLKAIVFFPDNKLSQAFIQKITYDQENWKLLNDQKETLIWNRLMAKKTISDYEHYILSYPFGKYISQAFENIDLLIQKRLVEHKIDIEERLWRLTHKINTISSYDAYIIKHQDGQYANLARINRSNLLKELEKEKTHWEIALNNNTIEDYTNYLEIYPGGEYAIDANNLRSDLRLKILAKQKEISKGYMMLSSEIDDNKLSSNEMNTNNTRFESGDSTIMVSEDSKKQVTFEKDTISTLDTSLAIIPGSDNNNNPIIEKSNLLTEEDRHYQYVIKLNNHQAYDEYLRTYPSSKYSDEIKDRMNNPKAYKNWDKALKRNNIEGFQIYINNNPSGKFRQLAYEYILLLNKERLVWTDAKNKATLESINNYLDLYPQGKYREEALFAVYDINAKADWDESKKINTIEAYLKFINLHPYSSYSINAKKRSENIEYYQWLQAREINTSESYTKFIKHYPSSQFKAEAISRKNNPVYHEWKRVTQLNTIDGYSNFIRDFPNSKYFDKANSKLNNLLAEPDWELAKKSNTIEGYYNFVKKHPKCDYTKLAQLNLQKLSTTRSK